MDCFECIEFNDLRDFYKKDVEIQTFELYLQEIYNQLSSKSVMVKNNSNNGNAGISKKTFTKYLLEMNIFICELK